MADRNEAEKGAHELDTTVRPASCSCGRAKFAGSPTFVRRRHAAHVEEAVSRPGAHSVDEPGADR